MTACVGRITLWTLVMSAKTALSGIIVIVTLEPQAFASSFAKAWPSNDGAVSATKTSKRRPLTDAAYGQSLFRAVGETGPRISFSTQLFDKVADTPRVPKRHDHVVAVHVLQRLGRDGFAYALNFIVQLDDLLHDVLAQLGLGHLQRLESRL
mmetsp:Transcript_7338/g.25730  ORF Transcript_7338/g.25730 Transcript_7338/m.25730 type:complete len:152 (+) Transcript_7338:481-936(+)